jgi:hypothetical protein
MVGIYQGLVKKQKLKTNKKNLRTEKLLIVFVFAKNSFQSKVSNDLVVLNVSMQIQICYILFIFLI